MQGISDQGQTAGDDTSNDLRQGQQHVDGDRPTQTAVAHRIYVMMVMIVSHEADYRISASLPLENQVNSDGNTNNVRKVAVNNPPTITVAKGF